ncbi:MAG: GatB/YqeY domain-containing protein [Rickettsiales bacterium TMED254]|nr:glutamyl-tRNA amidotransferase [Rickettsiales bacterium]RPF75773.1 MAG: GatB/YqeY domain-containing protein [Rickettsiales bacterium TMED254]|tara:strand:+ start:37 stop:498 length:462 start_codon:yes stop_codon:yes gene_type:complete
MSILREKFKIFLDEKIKNKENIAVATVRLILAAIKDRDIEHRAKNEENEISETEILNLLQNMVKQRKESVKIYHDAGRRELKEREEEEIKIIESFLPEKISNESFNAILKNLCDELDAKSIKDLGKVINTLKQRFPGQLDLKVVAKKAKDFLS